MRLLIYTSKATSLSEVGRQIGKVAEQMGYSVTLHRHALFVFDWRRYCDAAIFIFPYNPHIMGSYMLQYYEAKKVGVKVLWYGTIEGKINKVLIPEWVRREIECVACSNYVRKKLEEAGIKVVDVVLHGYPEWELEQACSLAPKLRDKLKQEFGDKVFFAVVADDNPRKALDKIIEAVKILSEKRDDFVVLFLSKNSVLRKIAGVPNTAFVGEFGTRSHYEILAFYRACDYLLFPSYSEGFGLPVLEANAVGVPAVINKLPVFEEFADLEHNIVISPSEMRYVDLNDGILYEFFIYDARELADALDYAIDIRKNYPSQYVDMSIKVCKKVKDLTSTNQYTKLLSLLAK